MLLTAFVHFTDVYTDSRGVLTTGLQPQAHSSCKPTRDK